LGSTGSVDARSADTPATLGRILKPVNRRIVNKESVIVITLVAVTFMVYWPPAGVDFINYDDLDYVTNNPMVRNGLTLESIEWAFTATVQDHWHPLTWFSHMLDVQLFGLNPRYHHMTSVVIHTVNAVLLFIIFRSMTAALWPSALIAFLFAVHPLHVESVMWVSERKDVLSTLFWALSIWAYLRYADRSERRYYFLSLFLFVLGLFSKPMVVTLPCLLLLLDFWPLARHQNGNRTVSGIASDLRLPMKHEGTALFVRLVIEKIPFFILAGALAGTLIVIHSGRHDSVFFQALPLPTRMANTTIHYMEYVCRTVWPLNLAIPYPVLKGVEGWALLWAIVFLLSVTAISLLHMKTAPYVLVGWLWFLGTLVPVIGLVATGPQYMADRYMYISIIGLFVIIVWGSRELFQRLPHSKRLVIPVGIGVVLTLSALSWRQAQYWKNSIELFSHTLKVTLDNEKAHNNLGTELARIGDHEAAVLHFKKALEINAGKSIHHHHHNLATALIHLHRWAEAQEHLEAAIDMDPGNYQLYLNLGLALLKQKKFDHVEENFKKSLEIKPVNAKAHYNLGVFYMEKGRIDEARRQVQMAIRINPRHALANRLADHLNSLE